VPDAIDVTQDRTHAGFNSSNQYLTRPPAFGQNIDHIYVRPGIGVTRWKLLIRLVHGKFPGIIPSDHNPIEAWLRLPY
jgi:endonuclease/exonuclease/phosphatase family metal-dependent hydrolase